MPQVHHCAIALQKRTRWNRYEGLGALERAEPWLSSAVTVNDGACSLEHPKDIPQV